MGREANPKIDCDATVDQHFEHICLQREGYLSKALKSPLTASARQNVLQAALRYMQSRTSQSAPPQSASQGVFTQGPAVAAGPLSSFQSLLSSLLTEELPPEVLIKACANAADRQFLPVLEKCLSLLANFGPIMDKKSVALDTQTQQDDGGLFEKDNVENEDPQILGSNQSGGTPSGNKVVVRRTGQSFVDDFVCKLVESAATGTRTQSRSNNIFVVSVAREAPLSDHATQVVFSHLTKNMKRVELVELPAYIYQLLLYASSRGDSQVKSAVLMHIAQVFSAHEEKLTRQHALSQSILAEDEDAITPSSTSLTDLRQIQGTALLHIEYVVKQDPSLANEIVRLTKKGVETPNHFLTSFGTGIVLSMARAISTRTDVLQILRDVILRFDKERVQRKNSLFMARVTMNDRKMADPCKSLLHIAKCTCENGWDNVKESLLQLALVLLDRPLPVHSKDVVCVSERLVDSIFLELFTAHPSMRNSILEQLTTRVALQEKSAPQAISVIDVLARQIPFFVMEHVRHIRDGIEVLVTLPSWLAHALMKAYTPLLVMRQDLHDYFQLVARKSLFHHNVSSRAVSIIAFLTLVSMRKASRSSKGSSKDSGSQSQRNPRAQDKEIDAIMESFQPLRRVFSYPAALKAFMYMNASYYLSMIDSERVAQNVATVMSDVFVNHLRRFVDAARAPYLLLDHCADTRGLIEPLGDLIWCLALVEVRKCRLSYKTSYILDVAKKVAGVSVQDFGITKEVVVQTQNDKGEDFSNGQDCDDNTPRVLRNKIRVLGSVCEALIHAVLIIPRQQQDWSLYGEIVSPLLSLRKQVVDILSHAGAATASDAFLELGGMATLERIRPGLRLMLQRNGKSSHPVKKSGGRKSKSNDAQPSAQGSPYQSHKIGLFSILASTSSKPLLPLPVSIQILQQMTDSIAEHSPDENIFEGNEGTSEFQELRVYLLSIAKKHIDDLIPKSSKPLNEVLLCKQPFVSMMGLMNSFLRIVMTDFEKYRETSSDIARQGCINALQAAESCAMVLPFAIRCEPKCLSDFCKALTPVSSDFDVRDETTLYETATELLEDIIDALIDDTRTREVGIALHIYTILVDSISSALDGIESMCVFLTKRIQWSVDALSRKEIAEQRIVKTIVKSCLSYTENNDDMKRAKDLCIRLLLVLGDCDTNAEPPDPNDSNHLDPKLVGAVAIDKDTCFALVEGVLEVADKAVVEVEWCLSRMVSLEITASRSDTLGLGSPGNDSSERTIIQDEMSKQAIRAEDAALLRLENIVGTLRALATCAIGKWSLQERLLRLVTKTYRVLSIATNAQAKRKGDPRTSFISLINEVKGLAPTLWTYLAFIGADPTGDTPHKKSGKAASEARVMPQLIYEVEKFEKVLISAQKRTKISLLRGMRRNIARDFRIREEVLHDIDEDGENGEGNAANEQESRNPGGRVGAKRRRVT